MRNVFVSIAHPSIFEFLYIYGTLVAPICSKGAENAFFSDIFFFKFAFYLESI